MSQTAGAQKYLKISEHCKTKWRDVLTLKVLVVTIDAQWEGMGDGVGEVRAGTTSPMPDHKGFKLH